jgi:hypothetical protein
MPGSTGRARRAVLVTALCAGVSLAHAQQLSSIESLNESYVACVQSAFVRRLDDFGVSNLPKATECAFIDCQLEEDALFKTAAASAPGDTQAIALLWPRADSRWLQVRRGMATRVGDGETEDDAQRTGPGDFVLRRDRR